MKPSQLAVALFARTRIPKRRQGARKHRTATDSAQALGTGIGRHRATGQRGAGRRAVRALAYLSLLAVAGLFTVPGAMGAFTHAPRHSTSTQDSLPSEVMSPCSPIRVRQTFSRSSAPRRRHGVVPQSCTWNLPTGCRLNIV